MLKTRVAVYTSKMHYVAVNLDLWATSLQYRFMHEAREAAKRLEAAFPANGKWIAVSDKPPMTPEQCCPWVKDCPNIKIDLEEDLYA